MGIPSKSNLMWELIFEEKSLFEASQKPLKITGYTVDHSMTIPLIPLVHSCRVEALQTLPEVIIVL